VFPLFIFVSWFLNKIYAKEAVVRESKIRKWLLYFTLFVAALVVVGDLVSVINNLLGGETTLKFILKALSILVVAGFVFGYYLDDVRRETPSMLGKIFAFITSFLVITAIIASFFVIGSPNSARLFQYDQTKISDLQNIQSQIVNYWQRKEALPATLNDLSDPISGFSIPQDSQTQKSYTYNITDTAKLSFQLCASFNKQSDNNQNSKTVPAYYGNDLYSQNWSHPAGYYCFERTIDKQLYPPLNKPNAQIIK
jgi:cell division protein FtsL